jgi:anaerobic dimethyl sulfoxide reductase subunit C
MHDNEWSLVLFTVLAQMAVGAFLTVQAIAVLFPADDALVNSILLLCLLLLLMGVLAAALHLGRPGRIPGVMANLPGSWLSREMLIGGVFGALLTGYVGVRWLEIDSTRVHDLLALTTGISGLALVLGMSRLYMLRTVPAWNTMMTPLAFFTTTFLLGSMLVATVCLAVYPVAETSQQALFIDDALQVITPVVVVLAGLQIVLMQQSVSRLGRSGGVALQSMKNLVDEYQAVFFCRIMFAALGAGMFAALVYQNADFAGDAIMRGLLMLAFALVLIAEVLGRFLFYASYQREGI